MRRRVLPLLLLAATVGGCQESGFDESKETARPLKVQHALGDIGGTKVPGQATRVATLTTDALGDTLALGVRPVWASVPGGRVPAYLRSRTAGLDVAAPVTKLDLAALGAANPGVILASVQAQKAMYPDLSKIAPTIATDQGGHGWELNLRLHGEALGRTNDAEQLLTQWDRRAAATRDAIGDESAAQTTVSAVLVTTDGVFVAGADSFAAKVLSDVGLKRPSQGHPGDRREVPGDDLSGVDADVILLSVATGAEGPARQLERNAAWRRLAAVRSGSVVDVDAGTWWSGGGILAARAALEDLDRAL